MSVHQSEQHYNDLSVEQLFKEYKQAVEAEDTLTVESISSVVVSWEGTKKQEYEEWCRLTLEWRPDVIWNIPIPSNTHHEENEAASKKPKLTLHSILELVESAEYQHMPDGRTTICMLRLKNGSTTVAHSQVLYAENNVPEMGENQAYQNALEKMWDLVGFKHHQERHELELVKNAILPGIQSLGDGADTQRALNDAWFQVSPAVQAVAIQLQAALMNHPVAKLKQDVAPSPNHVGRWPSMDTIDEIESTVDGMDEASLRETVRVLTQGYKNYCAHTAKQHSMLLRENSRLNNEVANPITNYHLTSRINMTAGNHPDGTVQQLRRQGGLIRDEVVELLGHLHMDALFKFDFVKMATKFQEAWGEAVGYGAAFDEEMDTALAVAEEFLKLHEYQKTLFTDDDLPGATINPHAIRDDIQDILVTTYGLSYYMGYDADEDHREVYRSNMTKFDTTAEGATATQAKYEKLGIKTKVVVTQCLNSLVRPILSEERLVADFTEYHIVKVDGTQTGNDGKVYPDGKFLKSINFEEPRYKPVIHRPLKAWGKKSGSPEDVPVEMQVDYSEVSPVVQETLNNPPDAYAGTPILERIVLHAPTHPGYFDDIKKSGENNAAFRTIMGRDMRPHEVYIAMVVGGERMARMAQILDGGGLVQLSELGVTEEMAKEALQRVCKGFKIHQDSYTPSDVTDFLKEAYQLHAAYKADFDRRLKEAVGGMMEVEQSEEALTFESLLDKASAWLNAADNGTEFTGRLRSLKETDLVTEVLDDREKLFFSRVSTGLLMREDGSSRTLADFLYQVTKLPPIRTEEEQ